MAEINNTDNNGKDIEQKKLSNTTSGHVSLYNYIGIVGTYLVKLHICILYHWALLFLAMKASKIHAPKDLCKNGHSGIIHNAPKLETT